MAIGGTRQKLSMIASFTNQGKARWMIIDGAFNHEKLIEFFELLIEDAGRKVLMILDNLSVHHCKPVKAWLDTHTDQIEVLYLPSYSPELNPEERLNADLKHVIGRKVPYTHQGQATGRCRGPHGDYRQRALTCESLFPGSSSKVCCWKLFKSLINNGPCTG